MASTWRARARISRRVMGVPKRSAASTVMKSGVLEKITAVWLAPRTTEAIWYSGPTMVMPTNPRRKQNFCWAQVIRVWRAASCFRLQGRRQRPARR